MSDSAINRATHNIIKILRKSVLKNIIPLKDAITCFLLLRSDVSEHLWVTVWFLGVKLLDETLLARAVFLHVISRIRQKKNLTNTDAKIGRHNQKQYYFSYRPTT